MFNLVIFGAPGSGKGTQSENLIQNYGLYHISTGDVLRDHIKRGTELGKIADAFISDGKLIPDDLMINILADVLDKNADATRNGVIFDGFPRTIEQAKALKTMLAERGTQVNAVIGLEVAEEELIDRLIKRGKDSGRADDASEEVIRNRIEVYKSQTAVVADHYLAQGKYENVQSYGTIDEVFGRICSAVEKYM